MRHAGKDSKHLDSMIGIAISILIITVILTITFGQIPRRDGNVQDFLAHYFVSYWRSYVVALAIFGVYVVIPKTPRSWQTPDRWFVRGLLNTVFTTLLLSLVGVMGFTLTGRPFQDLASDFSAVIFAVSTLVLGMILLSPVIVIGSYISYRRNLAVERHWAKTPPMGEYSDQKTTNGLPALVSLAAVGLMVVVDVNAPVALESSLLQNVTALTFILAGLVGVIHTSVFVSCLREHPDCSKLGEIGLVTEGPYSLSRNPECLSWFLVITGFALLLGNLINAAIVVLFPFITYFWVIKPEEAFLAKNYGAQYKEYRRRVRRWI